MSGNNFLILKNLFFLKSDDISITSRILGGQFLFPRTTDRACNDSVEAGFFGAISFSGESESVEEPTPLSVEVCFEHFSRSVFLFPTR